MYAVILIPVAYLVLTNSLAAITEDTSIMSILLTIYVAFWYLFGIYGNIISLIGFILTHDARSNFY